MTTEGKHEHREMRHIKITVVLFIYNSFLGLEIPFKHFDQSDAVILSIERTWWFIGLNNEGRR